jgi:5-methylcytosine-specific restriction enzyme A
MRKEFTAKTKALAFQRANGRCEGDGCGARLTVGKFHYDHDDPDGLTGAPTLDNCRVLCVACHAVKTKRDIANIARAKRREARHIGAKRSSHPLPFGKQSPWKKKMDGSIVRRA